jgi:hypothetical protein
MIEQVLSEAKKLGPFRDVRTSPIPRPKRSQAIRFDSRRHENTKYLIQRSDANKLRCTDQSTSNKKIGIGMCLRGATWTTRVSCVSVLDPPSGDPTAASPSAHDVGYPG